MFWQYQTQRYLDQTVVDDKFAKAALVHFQRLVSFVVQFRSHKQFAINAFNSHVMAAHNGCADKAQKANYVFPILEVRSHPHFQTTCFACVQPFHPWLDSSNCSVPMDHVLLPITLQWVCWFRHQSTRFSLLRHVIRINDFC